MATSHFMSASLQEGRYRRRQSPTGSRVRLLELIDLCQRSLRHVQCTCPCFVRHNVYVMALVRQTFPTTIGTIYPAACTLSVTTQTERPSLLARYTKGRAARRKCYCSEFDVFPKTGPLSHIVQAKTSYCKMPAAASSAQVASVLSAVQKQLEKVSAGHCSRSNRLRMP